MEKDLGCGCGHDHEHDHDEDMEIITITLEDGTELECAIMGIFEVEEKEYMALWAMEPDEVLLFGYKELEDEFEITPIEDDEEFDLVSEAYYVLFSDEEGDFDEEE